MNYGCHSIDSPARACEVKVNCIAQTMSQLVYLRNPAKQTPPRADPTPIPHHRGTEARTEVRSSVKAFRLTARIAAQKSPRISNNFVVLNPLFYSLVLLDSGIFLSVYLS